MFQKKMQSDRGDFTAGETMYSHGAVTIAIAEAYGMTGDPSLLDPLRAAVDFIVYARNRRTGGWRYVPGHARHRPRSDEHAPGHPPAP